MSFFKKLHIKIFSVALLVSLVSYGGLEHHVLPQQFGLEQIFSDKHTKDAASYSVLGIAANETSINTYVSFDFQNSLETYNAKEKITFDSSSFNSNLLKETRQNTHFLTRLKNASKEAHTSII